MFMPTFRKIKLLSRATDRLNKGVQNKISEKDKFDEKTDRVGWPYDYTQRSVYIIYYRVLNRGPW